MSYQLALDLLREIIEKKQKEPPLPKCSDLFLLLKSLYLSLKLQKNFREYTLYQKEELVVPLFSSANIACGFIEEVLHRNNLSQNYIFILETLYPMTEPLQDMMIHVRENLTPLDKVENINNFIIQKLEEICLELDALKYPLDHDGIEFSVKVMAWWDDYKTSKI